VLPAVAYTLIAASMLGGLWSLLLVVRNRSVTDTLVWLLSALELALLVQLVGGCVALVTTERDVSAGLFVGYLLTAVLVLPLGVAWAASEKSRWGPGVLAVACTATAALVQRILDVWRA
jgi:xanthine/uracil/vitamin C permease (AzgA family)